MTYGVLTLFGRSDGATQVAMRDVFPIATQLWGALLISSAALLWLGWSVIGAAGAALAWTILTVAAVVVINHGGAVSTAGWVPFAFIGGCHVLVIFEVLSGLDADRELRQRRE